MIISQLSITNFGVYNGLHEFNLRPQRVDNITLPVVLIGGKNGAGKTTILEAIRLCLYGRSTLGMRVRKADYETYIKQRFHRSPNIKYPTRTASIGITFEHVYAGHKSLYDAVRSWRIEGRRLHETVSIYKDGQVLHDITPDYWNDFLRDLIPPGVADLFFFDGEQIQALADDETETGALEDAISGLLNIDIVERLQTDLNMYVKQRDGQNRSSLHDEVNQLTGDYKALEQQYIEKKQDRASLRTQLDHIEKQLREARQALISEGAQFIKNRSSIEVRLEQIETDIQVTRNNIKELAIGLLPFAITPDWIKRLRQRLVSEEETQKQSILFGYQQSKADDVKSRMKSPDFKKQFAKIMPDDDWKNLLTEVDNLIQPDESSQDDEIIHHISEQQRLQLLRQIDITLNDIPKQMQTLGHQLEALEDERRELRHQSKQIPDDDTALPLIKKFQGLSEKSGRVQEQISMIDDELSKFQFQLAGLERERSKAWHKLANADDIDNRVDYAAKIQVVLDKYLKRIRVTKINELEQLVAQYFNLLCRKDMIIKEVKINPKSYVVSLYGDNRDRLHKTDLSAGEKQLYAMSLLWALRSVSGRQLPIIVDTPMGRLDSEHRHRLLTEFFPNAAHQVILLSTDTEVDAQAFELLKPYISHVYRLDFDNDTGETIVEHAYFGTSEGELIS